MNAPLLCCYQARELLDARRRCETRFVSSLDLGLSAQSALLEEEEAHFESGLGVSWQELERIAQTDNVCFEYLDGEFAPIRAYFEDSERSYQLMPTPGPPALLISGFVMHRIRDVSPQEGAARMVRALGPLHGRVLDTTTGLGYAAIEAARRADAVVTIELDAGAQAMARRNPWSRALFEDPKISQLLGDSSRLIEGFEPGAFSAVVHDPPAINVAGELYSRSFYEQVWRVLGRSGRFFHYIGDPESASGARATSGVRKRLQAAGFSKITPRPEAFGLLAQK